MIVQDIITTKPIFPRDNFTNFFIFDFGYIFRNSGTENGFSKIILTVKHLADMIISYFGNGSKFGIKIDYTVEEKPLSTMGPLKLCKNLEDDFLVINGDVLTDLNLSLFFKEHINNSELFTIASKKRIEKIDYGVLKVDNESILTAMEEKPEKEFLVSMGIYAINKKALDYIPEN